MPGFSVERINELTGLENIMNGYLDLEEVRVPEENRIGDEGQGWRIMMSGLNYERVVCASLAVGSFRELLKNVVSYGQRRIQFGQTTLNLLTNQFKVADILAALKLSRLSTYYAARLMDSGEGAAVECSICKLCSTDMLMQSSIEAVQIMGGDGATRFYPVGGIMRDAKVGQIAGGTNEAMKLLIYGLGLRQMAEDVKMPRRILHKELRIPVPAATVAEKKSKIDADKLRCTGDYMVNPGLYMTREDIKQRFDVEDAELDNGLLSLEEKKLVKLFRGRGGIELAKANYNGLRKAHPREYYRCFPSRVRKEDLF